MLHLFPAGAARRRARAPGGFPFASASLATFVAAAFLVPGAAEALELDREAVLRGEWWRAITCHFVHYGLDHLIWDGLVFAALAAVCERRGRARLLFAMPAAGAAVSLGVLLFLPGLAAYRGLSGLDCALAGLLASDIAVEALRERQPRRVAAAAAFLACFLAKTGYEAATGATLFVDSAGAGFQAVPLAHVVGLAAGSTVPLFWAGMDWNRELRPSPPARS